MHNINRRSLFKTLLVGAGAAPALAPFKGRFLPNAHASTTGAPRRIIFIDIPNGLPDGKGPQEWYGYEGSSPTDLKLGVVLAPLERHKADMVIINGMQYKKPPGYRDSSAHGVGLVMMLTGSVEVVEGGAYKSMNASLDQYLAKHVGMQATPKFPVLMTGVQCQGKTHSYGDARTRIFNNQDPLDVYNKLFGNLATMGTAAAPKPDPAVVGRLMRRQSVLDNVKTELKTFRSRLGKYDQERADAQLASIRLLEERLASAMGAPGGQVTGDACTKPNSPGKVDYMNSVHVPMLCRLINDMVVAAFACDLTRIVNIQYYGGDDPNARTAWAPINLPGSDWHSISHLLEGEEKFKQCKQFMTGIVAELIDHMKMIPEAGGTMFDNTLIFIAAENGLGHSHSGFPYCLLGGKNMGIKVGRHFKVGTNSSGMENNRLLVSFLNAMGMPDETYGQELAGGRGPIPGLLA